MWRQQLHLRRVCGLQRGQLLERVSARSSFRKALYRVVLVRHGEQWGPPLLAMTYKYYTIQNTVCRVRLVRRGKQRGAPLLALTYEYCTTKGRSSCNTLTSRRAAGAPAPRLDVRVLHDNRPCGSCFWQIRAPAADPSADRIRVASRAAAASLNKNYIQQFYFYYILYI